MGFCQWQQKKTMKEDLIEITEDGIISKEELPKLKAILERLEKIAEIISEMKIVGEKFIKEGDNRLRAGKEIHE